MTETQIYFIGTSKIKEIRAGGNVTFQWGAYGPWTKFKSPAKHSAKNVKYNKNTKNKVGSQKLGGNGGITKLGTAIPATATRTISGVQRTCDVRYYQRGYTIYTRTKALKKKKKMLKTTYTSSKPYQYRLQYKDKPVVDKAYSQYIDGKEYIYFSEIYYDDAGVQKTSPGFLPHPNEHELTYSDVRRNFESNANNSDSRDNTGTYVLSNVRANVVSLSLAWKGLLSPEEGMDLLDTLNPSKDSKGKYNYLTVQYLDPASGKIKNGTFYAGERKVLKYPNGYFREISVTLTEV